MPLRIVNCCWSGFPCKWRYINVVTFNLFNLLSAKQKVQRSLRYSQLHTEVTQQAE